MHAPGTHPEAKSLGPDGKPCNRRTIGLLQRRPVMLDHLIHIGKETNRLEEVEAEIEHSPDEIWTEYRDPRRDPWETRVRPVLKLMPIERIVNTTGLHKRSLFVIRAGERGPHPRNRQALVAAAGTFARERLGPDAMALPDDDLTACAGMLALRPRHSD